MNIARRKFWEKELQRAFKPTTKYLKTLQGTLGTSQGLELGGVKSGGLGSGGLELEGWGWGVGVGELGLEG